MLKIIGLGMPRTGTRSLCDALNLLDIKCGHHEPQRLDPWAFAWDADSYDDLEAIVDFPASYMWEPIAKAYDVERFILTIRDPRKWYESAAYHTARIMTGGNAPHIEFTARVHALLFGSVVPVPYLWMRRYEEWNEAIRHRFYSSPVRCGQLLELNICDGVDGWGKLCDFVGVVKPDLPPFPHSNKRE